MLGVAIVLFVIITPILIAYLYLVGDGINWKYLWRISIKYGPIIAIYIFITTFLYQIGIIPYNSAGLLFNIWPLILVFFSLRNILDEKEDNSTAFVLLIIGISFSSMFLLSLIESIASDNTDSILASISGLLSVLPGIVLLLFFPTIIIAFLLSFIFRDK